MYTYILENTCYSITMKLSKYYFNVFPLTCVAFKKYCECFPHTMEDSLFTFFITVVITIHTVDSLTKINKKQTRR